MTDKNNCIYEKKLMAKYQDLKESRDAGCFIF